MTDDRDREMARRMRARSDEPQPEPDPTLSPVEQLLADFAEIRAMADQPLPPRYEPGALSKRWRGYVHVCRECGVLVADMDAHDKHHRELGWLS